MADLKTALGLADGTLFEAKIKAHNVNGDSPVSSASIATVKAQSQPTTAPTDMAMSTFSKSTIKVAWTNLTTDADNGYSAITEYKVYTSTDTVFSLAGTISSLTAELEVTGLTVSTAYKFKITAINIHGESAMSSEVIITTANIPDTPDAVVVTQVGTQLTFDWSAPFKNLKDITSYIVKFYDSTASFAAHTAICDPSASGVTAFDQTKCASIEMAALKSELSLSAGADIRVTVEAVNSEGTSFTSDENSDSLVIQVIPTASPSTFATSSLTDTSVVLTWDAIASADTGYSPITAYTIYLDDGSTNTTLTSTTTALTYTVSTGLVANTAYTFHIFASNVHGPSVATPT